MAQEFATRLLEWWDVYGRKDLPWQADADPYKIWLSEVMLQQTQVTTVIPYFLRFIERFPEVTNLASADQDEVLHLWSGLGYYARGRNLHAAAKKIVADFNGMFPDTQEDLESLPGIGRSTAGAIRAQAFGQRAPILDGNVKRVLSRMQAIQSWPGENAVQNRLWELSGNLLPENRLRDYTQAIMDLGATVCSRSKPLCSFCPVKQGCKAFEQGLTSKIPASKPKKKTPVREVVFLCVKNSQGQLLLEKRPPTGIWGGLWSFPEIQPDQLATSLQARQVENFQKTWLEEDIHTFSHFRLKYRPLLVELDRLPANEVNEPEQQIWYSPNVDNEIGLAAPVARLLARIQEIANE